MYGTMQNNIQVLAITRLLLNNNLLFFKYNVELISKI